MVVRQRRKLNKLRGNRTHGKGNTKNHRGAGCRGGVGKAGSHKHKFSKHWVDFVKGHKLRLHPTYSIKSINIEDLSKKLDDLVEKKLVAKDEDTYIIDGNLVGYEKILGRGTLKQKVVVKNMQVSKIAQEKIMEVGGEILTKDDAPIEQTVEQEE